MADPSEGAPAAPAPTAQAEIEALRRRIAELEPEADQAARYRAFFDQSPNPLFTFARDGLYSYVNPAFARGVGKPAAEIIGKHIGDVFPPAEAAQRLRSLESVFATGAPKVIEVSVPQREGEPRWYVTSILPIRDAEGAVSSVACTSTEITEHRRSESSVRTLSRAIEQSSSPIVITDPVGAIEYVNPAFERITGYSREEVLGRNPRFLKSGRTPSEVYGDLWRRITSGEEWRGEICNRRKDGELYWEQIVVSGIRDEDGRIRHFVAVTEDVTGRKRAQTARAQLEAELRHAEEMETAGRLTGGVLHDLEGMLRAILSRAKVAWLSLAPADPLRADLQAIADTAERSGQIAQRLLAFAKGSPDAQWVLDLTKAVAELARPRKP
jgi:PAS domain S-box-containing protein